MRWSGRPAATRTTSSAIAAQLAQPDAGKFDPRLRVVLDQLSEALAVFGATRYGRAHPLDATALDSAFEALPAATLAPAQREIVRVEVRDPHVLRQLDERGHVRKLADMEADIIRFALTYYRGQMSEAARKLGIGRSTLYRKMKELGLQEEADMGGEGSDSAAA